MRVCGLTDDALSPEAFLRIRSHPGFRAVVEDHCRMSLEHHAAQSREDRWLVSDLGRQSLSRAMMILDAVFGEVSVRALVDGAQSNRTCSRGRVLAFLRRAESNGMISGPAARSEMDRIYSLGPRFIDAMAPYTDMMVRSVARLAPETASVGKATIDPGFRRSFMTTVGRLSVRRRDLFAGPDRPVLLFLAHDGGERILERLIISQPCDRLRLLEGSSVSLSSLARSAFTSRQHVTRLLEAGQREGYLDVSARGLTFSPVLSDDIERHFALIFGITRAAALQTTGDPRPALRSNPRVSGE